MVQQKKSSILAKIGDRLQAAHDQYKDAETEYSNFGDLPAGINGGVAQVVTCKIDTYKSGDLEGELYFYADAAVITPKEHDGIEVAGLRTKIMEPLCDTPGRTRETLEDHIAEVYQHIRRMGWETSDMAWDELEDTLAAIVEAGPYIRFRTWSMPKQVAVQRNDGKWVVMEEDSKGNRKPSRRTTGVWPTEDALRKANKYIDNDPMVNHTWNGHIPDYVPPDVNGSVDRTAAPKAAPQQASPQTQRVAAQPQKPTAQPGPKARPQPTAPMTAAKAGPKPAPQPPTPATRKPVPAPKASSQKAPARRQPEPEPEPEAFNEFGDLESLVDRANRMDNEAIQELVRRAVDVGYTESDINGAESWNEVVGWITGDEEATQQEEHTEEVQAEDEDEFAPEEDQVWYYYPVNPKTKKRGKRIEAKVIGVQKRTKTVTLQDVATEQEYRNVPYDDLKGDEE